MYDQLQIPHDDWSLFNRAVGNLQRYEWIFIKSDGKPRESVLKTTEQLSLTECELVCQFPWMEGIR